MISPYLKRQNGFTLIELLTIIAIIGILAAIIIPTVGRVRETAKSAKCATNLRNWYLIISLYAQDHKGTYAISANGEGWASAVKGSLYFEYFSNAEEIRRVRVSPLAPKDSTGITYVLAWLPDNSGVYPDYSSVLLLGGNPSRQILMSYSIPYNPRTTTSKGFENMRTVIEPLFAPEYKPQVNSINVLFADGHVGKAHWNERKENDPNSFLSQQNTWFVSGY